MLKLDNNLLEEIGLGSLPEDQKKAMLQHIYDTLELRVGTQLANQMTDQQLEEFEKFIDDDPNASAASQPEALQWLESNLPNYKDVVNQVFEQLKAEIKEMAPQIVASSQQMQDATAAQPPAAGPAAPMADPAAAPAPQAGAQPGYGMPPSQGYPPAGAGLGPYGPAPAYQPQYSAAGAPQQPYAAPVPPPAGSQPMSAPGGPQPFQPPADAAQFGGQPYPAQPPAGPAPQYGGAGQAAQPPYGQPGPGQPPYQDPGQQAA